MEKIKKEEVIIPDDTLSSEESTDSAESMSALSKKGLCQTSRGFESAYGSAKDTTQGQAYLRHLVIEGTIVNALLYGFRKKEDVFRYFYTRYPEIKFKNDMQELINRTWDGFYIMRYLNAEKRSGTYAPLVIVEVKDRKYRIKASIMFVSGENRDSVELVKFKIGRSTGGDPFARDLQLYCMLLAGKKLGFKNIKASFYYLAKESDGKTRSSCDRTFFGEGIVTRTYDGEKTDKEMEKFFETVEAGIPFEDMEEDSCTYCQTFHVCHYKKAPKPFEEEDDETEVLTGEVVEPAPKKPLFPLSPAQQTIVDMVKTFVGIILVNAGAGSGKTATITRSVQELVDSGVAPETIMMITFTDSACKEMKKRLHDLIADKAELVKIFTFNGLGNEILMKNWEWGPFGFARKPKLISNPERFDIVKEEILDKHPIREWTGQSIKNLDNPMKNSRQRSALDLMSDIFDYIRASGLPSTSIQAYDVDHITKGADISPVAVRKIIDLYPLYDKFLAEKGLYNYSDQLRLTLKFLEAHDGYLEEAYGIRHFFIDEFQDTSEEQIDLVNHFTKTGKLKNLTLVGDDDQAIYGSFRNTSSEYIQSPENYIDFPGGGIIRINLLDNYRCSANVIEASNIVVARNRYRTVKALNATRDAGASVVAKGFYRKAEEYEYIVKTVEELISGGAVPEDIAVITYTKSELLELSDLLSKKNVPVMYAAPEPLLENSRIIAIIEFAKLIEKPDSIKCAVTAANAVMDGGFMDLSKEDMDAEIKKMVGLVHAINEKETLEAKKALFYEFIDMVAHGDEAVEFFKGQLDTKEFDEMLDYLYKFERYGQKEEYRRLKSYPGVCMTTAHSAKGREWKYVIASLSKFRSLGRDYEEEKRRLLFVTMTRAKDFLYVTSQYAVSGSTKNNRVINNFICEVFDALGQSYTIDFDAYEAMQKKLRLAAKAAKTKKEDKPGKSGTKKAEKPEKSGNGKGAKPRASRTKKAVTA